MAKFLSIVFVGVLAGSGLARGQDTQPLARRVNLNARYEIAWATCLGGPGRDWLNKIVVMPDESLVVGGWAATDGCPTTEGVVQPRYAGGPYKGMQYPPNAGDFYVARLSPSGQLLAATYFGGSNNEYQFGLAVDPHGNVIIAGETRSADLPATPGSAQPTFGGTVDWFTAKLTDDLERLLWCTYLGGPGWDGSQGSDPILDAAENVILFGDGQAGFPQPEEDRRSGSLNPKDRDIFVAKLKADGSGVVFCSRFGGEGPDSATGGAVLQDGSIILTGHTRAPDFPWPAKTTRVGILGGGDAFVAKLRADGSELDAMTLFGGGDSDHPGRPVVASDGSIFVAGGTFSVNFPTTPGAHQSPSATTIDDSFIVKLSEPGAGLQFSATIRGDDRVGLGNIRLGSNGLLWVSGATAWPNLPITGDALHFYAGGEADGILVAFAPDGSRPVFLTFLGGMDKDSISDFAFGSGGAIYVVGGTTSDDFPTTAGALQRKPIGREDGFVMKLVPTPHGAASTRASVR